MSEYTVIHGIRISKDFTPETFGRLTTLGPKFRLSSPNTKARHTVQVYACSCGNITLCAVINVQAGRTQSCGCLNDESRVASNTKHGHTSGGKWSLTYSSFTSMKQRCYYSESNRYCMYGERGIVICDRWMCPINGFLNFMEDMGPRPSRKHSIERDDVDGNYCPENCRWATAEEQARNKRNNINLTYKDKTQCISAWAEEMGIKPVTVNTRIKSGWSVEEALTTPTGSTRKSRIGQESRSRSKINNHNLTYKGETRCISAWAEETGIGQSTLSYRIRHGWSVERALTTPTRTLSQKHA